jgi:hypothetical protein
MFCKSYKRLKTKMIAVSEKTHHKLARLGNFEDSFDTVISRLIEEAAMSDPTLAGTGQNITAALRSASAKGATASSNE